jgi:diadenosine tetraphosphate (Ap4A) HIT family hydrolase
VGLLASVGVQKFSALAPKVVKETDKTIVIEHPRPAARLHYLVIPKKDIKNLGEFAEADGEYLVDAFKVAREIIREKISPTTASPPTVRVFKARRIYTFT